MDGYVKVSLSKLISQIGEDNVKNILSDFSCPINSDIETLKKKLLSLKNRVYLQHILSLLLTNHKMFLWVTIL